MTIIYDGWRELKRLEEEKKAKGETTPEQKPKSVPGRVVYDAERGKEALKRAENGEENIIDTMEREGQRRVARDISLPREMTPSKEVWEKMGFVFYETKDPLFYKAILPAGWKIVPTDNPMWSNIVDARGLIRAQIFYKAAFYSRMAHMSLSVRYGIQTKSFPEEPEKVEIYFGNEKEVLFVAGSVSLPANPTSEQITEYYATQDKLFKAARKFAEEHYPGWGDPMAYWDEEPAKTQEGPKLS